jgi:predicted PurR-regulated permease PerM
VSIFDRFRRREETPVPESAHAAAAPTVVQIDASSLSRVFSAPVWVRDLGLMAWFLVGVAILLVGLTWLLALTSTITIPVVIGAILATVAGPLVTKLQGRGVPRLAGAAIVLLGLIALAVLIFLLVVGGLSEQSSEIKSSLNEAVDKIEDWANDAGVDSSSTTDNAKDGATASGKTLLEGVVNGIQGLTSLVFFVTFSAFATFFLLKDGPVVRRFVDRHLGVPLTVATVITGNVIQSLRRYFLGVTIVA